MKLTITKVNWDDKNKEGQPLINKFGKPYFKVGIKTNEFGDTYLNGLMPFAPTRWEGTQQELEVYDEEYNGKQYKKFKLPPREKGGVPAPEFAEIAQEYLESGKVPNGGDYDLNDGQKYVLKLITKIVRNNK